MSGDWKRIRLTVSYDGTAYSGWQRQINAPSIQQMLENSLVSLTGEPHAITGASRTDAGVHALGQVAHFDSHSSIPPEKYSYALNTQLPADIRVTESFQVDPSFHARYSANGKTYRYQIHNHPHASALYRNQRAHVALPLNVEAMRKSSLAILGEHDFGAFAASGSEAKSTIRDIRSIAVTQQGDLIEIVVAGRSFLYNMVRILAGTMIYVGLGKLPETVLAKALETRNRLDLGITAPPQGLTLVEVRYGESDGSNAPKQHSLLCDQSSSQSRTP